MVVVHRSPRRHFGTRRGSHHPRLALVATTSSAPRAASRHNLMAVHNYPSRGVPVVARHTSRRATSRRHRQLTHGRTRAGSATDPAISSALGPAVVDPRVGRRVGGDVAGRLCRRRTQRDGTGEVVRVLCHGPGHHRACHTSACHNGAHQISAEQFGIAGCAPGIEGCRTRDSRDDERVDRGRPVATSIAGAGAGPPGRPPHRSVRRLRAVSRRSLRDPGDDR